MTTIVYDSNGIPLGEIKPINLPESFAVFKDETIPGLHRAEFSIELNWEPHALQQMELAITPSEPQKHIGKFYHEFDAYIGDDFSTLRRMAFFLPMDRRQARRLARKTGWTFRMKDGQPRFKRQ